MTLHILPLMDSNHTKSGSRRPTQKQAPSSLRGFVLNERFYFVEKIGAGTFGLIYLVQDMVTGAKLAAKLVMVDPPNVSKLKSADSKRLFQETIFSYFDRHQPIMGRSVSLESIKNRGSDIPALREIALHLRVHDHPNIVTIHHVLLIANFAVVTLMDYFPQGDLFGNIIDRQIFSSPPEHQDRQLLEKNCMLQLVEAVAHCAANGVYHCDLKPENVMVHYNPDYRRSTSDRGQIIDYNELQVSLIDFGLAMSSSLICCNVCRGSSFYMAPERIVNYNTNNLVKSLINMEQFKTDENSKSEQTSKLLSTLAGDVWSLGVLFVNITCSRNPWPIANINDRHEVFANYILSNNSILRSILPISQQFNELLNDIFKLNPNERISLKALSSRIASCDFYNDPVEFNSQLYTPPNETHSVANTPVSSMTGLDSCRNQAKLT